MEAKDIQSQLVIRLTPQEIVQKMKQKYKAEFGKLNDQAYFIAGFLLSVFDDMGNPDIIEIKKEIGT